MATHVDPPVHFTPHAPQLLLSVCKKTHAPLQSVVPPASAQPEPQVPVRQTWLAVQAVPHTPQLAGSVARFAHVPLQSEVPPVHWHRPAAHDLPPVQALPHAPQLALFDVVSKQPPPQAVKPVLHDAAHAPKLQTKLAPHALPHEPQLATLVLRSTQAPLHEVPVPQPEASPITSVWTTSVASPPMVASPPVVPSVPIPSGWATSLPPSGLVASLTFPSFETTWSPPLSNAGGVLSLLPQAAKETAPTVAMSAAASLLPMLPICRASPRKESSLPA